MNSVAKSNPGAVTAEQVLIRGDLSSLDEKARVKYYADVCHSVGLNPLTKPFEYIQLNGKLRLYALKDCTDQLRSLHKVSVTDMTESERDGVCIVKCKVQNGEGRTDMAIGAVNIAGLKGEALANALMKAETKSKRRATLSICGLGMLDETEVDDIPANQKQVVRVPSPTEIEKVVEDDPATPVDLTPFKDEKFPSWSDRFIASIHTAQNHTEVDLWCDLNRPYLDMIKEKAKAVDTKITKALTIKRASFQKDDPITSGPQKASKGPDFVNNYDAWFDWCLTEIRTCDDGGALETFFNDEIEAKAKDIFPTDMADLADEFGKRQEQLRSADENG
jgi:hypothetical protein